MPIRSVLSDQCAEALRRINKPQDKESVRPWRQIAGDLSISENQLYRMLNGSRGGGAAIAKRLAEYVRIPQEQVFVSPND